MALGAENCIIQDMRHEFITDFVWPSVEANLIYEDRYLLGTAIARPCIVRLATYCTSYLLLSSVMGVFSHLFLQRASQSCKTSWRRLYSPWCNRERKWSDSFWIGLLRARSWNPSNSLINTFLKQNFSSNLWLIIADHCSLANIGVLHSVQRSNWFT